MRYIQPFTLERSRLIKNRLSQILHVSFTEDSLIEIWLEKQEAWVAVPVIGNDNFTDFASGLLRIATDISYQELLGVFLETEIDKPLAFSVPSHIDGIYEFNTEPPPSHKVIFAGAPDFLALMAESDYYVIAGSIPIVEKFLDISVNQAFTEFRNYIESWKFPEQFAQRLQPFKHLLWGVYINTFEIYENAPVGSRVKLNAPVYRKE
ncbi:MAG: hypothetical protein AAFX80_13045 [Cyanobacteria bacterium J06639_18]